MVCNNLRAAAEAEIARRQTEEGQKRADDNLLYELQVHQIELEIQNESLRDAIQALEEARDRYVDLYEFSPVGYLTLTDSGLMQEVNAASVQLFGQPRDHLLGRRFEQFISTDTRQAWQQRYPGFVAQGGAIDLILASGDNQRIYVHVACSPLQRKSEPAFMRVAITDISERKRMEDQLRASEERLQYALDASTDGIWDHDLRTGVIFRSPSYAKTVGYPPEEITPDFDFFKRLIHPDDRDWLMASIKAHIQARAPSGEFEHRQITYAGETRWIRTRGRVVEWDTNGAPLRIVGSISDITERKLAEQARRESDERFRQLFEVETDAVVLVDCVADRFIEVNEAALQLYGYSRDEFLSLNIADISLEPAATLAGIHSGETIVPCRRHRRKDGSAILIEARLSFFTMAGRKVHVAAIRDITARMQAELALRRSEELLRTYHETTTALMGIVELGERDILYVYNNPASCRLLGIEYGSSVGRWASSIGVPSPVIAVMTEKYRECGRKGEAINFDLSYEAADHTRWLDVTVAPLAGSVSQLPRFCYFALDVTGVKKAHSELERVNAELQSRTRHAELTSMAKSRFLAGISHELRTPLHTILGYVKLLRQNTAGSIQQQLSIAERSGQQLRYLLDELLEFNRGEFNPRELQLERVDLAGSLELVIQSAELLAQDNGNAFTPLISDDLPAKVWMDEKRLLQVLQNLVGNACKYTHNGQIVFRVERMSSPHSAMAIGCCRLRFAIEDTGIGIPSDELDHIFDAFRRGSTACEKPGLGLGLTVAQEWVRAMGGVIEVRSILGLGSCFSFELDLRERTAEKEVADSDGRTGNSALAKNSTVLVVDDLAENRALLRAHCEAWGYTVLEAEHGEAALATCLFASPEVNLVLVDQIMPRLDGWGFLQRVRQSPYLQHITVVLISASESTRPLDCPIDMEFDLVLGKPLDDEVLRNFLSLRCAAAQKPQSKPEESETNAGHVALPRQEYARFTEMLNSGQVPAIATWARELAATDTKYAGFTARVVALCLSADLAGLERILNEQKAAS